MVALLLFGLFKVIMFTIHNENQYLAPIAEQTSGFATLSSSSNYGAMKKQNIIGPTVRRMRVEAGLSQEQLATKIQVAGWDLSRGGLSKIEAQLRRVNDAELLILARVFNCETQDLYPDKVTDIEDVMRQGRG